MPYRLPFYPVNQLMVLIPNILTIITPSVLNTLTDVLHIVFYYDNYIFYLASLRLQHSITTWIPLHLFTPQNAHLSHASLNYIMDPT